MRDAMILSFERKDRWEQRVVLFLIAVEHYLTSDRSPIHFSTIYCTTTCSQSYFGLFLTKQHQFFLRWLPRFLNSLSIKNFWNRHTMMCCMLRMRHLARKTSHWLNAYGYIPSAYNTVKIFVGFYCLVFVCLFK